MSRLRFVLWGAFLFGAHWPSDAQTLRYGSATVSFAFAPMYVAEDGGFFAKEGLTLQGELMSGSGVGTAAVIAGDLPFYVGLPQTASLAIAQHEPLRPFAEVTQQFAIDIVTSKEAAARAKLTAALPVEERLRALRGLSIASWSPGSAPNMLMRFLTAQLKMAPGAIKSSPIGPGPLMLAALQNGRVDGFAFSSPTSDEAVRRLGAFMLYSGAAGDWRPLQNEPFITLISSQKWLDEHRRQAAGIYRGLSEAMEFMRSHPDQTKAILRKRMKSFSDDDFEAGLKNLPAMIPDSPALTRSKAAQVSAFMSAVDPELALDPALLTGPNLGSNASPH